MAGLPRRIIKVSLCPVSFSPDPLSMHLTLIHTSFSILQETQRLMAEPVPGISAIPDENNARYFHVVVAGPEGVCVLLPQITHVSHIFFSC